MTASTSFLLITVIMACSVETVEALTIILASGISRGWRSTIEGAALALVTLAAIVLIVGPVLINYIPIDILRILVGTLLLIFGLQWLSKAILRASGFKAKHDEAAIYQKTLAELSQTKGLLRGKRDSVAFVISLKGVFLEGMEVIMIVISFGLPNHQLGIASLGAAIAVIVVGAIGLIVAKPLAKVPENTMKLGVGILLTVFGIFWMGEGVGVDWPLADTFIFILITIILVVVVGLIAYLRSRKNKLTREEIGG